MNCRLNTTIHTSCSKPIGPGLVSGDFLVVAGTSKEGGPLCPAQTPPSGCKCDGKVNWLKLRYMAKTAARIKVVQKDGKVVFDRCVQPNGVFDFRGKDKKNTLGTEIKIYVSCRLNATIHTSCSKPIGPGLVAGSFLVVEGTSRNGGKLCPMPGTVASKCKPCEDDDPECDHEDGDTAPCDTSKIVVGDTLLITLTVTANMPTDRVVEVRDYLDSCLEFLSADKGGTYVGSGHFVRWSVPVSEGPSVTKLHLRVKITELPNGDNGECPEGWNKSDCVELVVWNASTSSCDPNRHRERNREQNQGSGQHRERNRERNRCGGCCTPEPEKGILKNCACINCEPPEPEIKILKSGRKICPTGPCGRCDGKVNRLRLRYTGTVANASVKVVQKKVDGPVFTGTVQPGGEFDFRGTDKKDTLGTEISIYVNGQLNAKIHTSCSQPIGPGLQKGDFLVVAGTSRNGGALRPLQRRWRVRGRGLRHLEDLRGGRHRVHPEDRGQEPARGSSRAGPRLPR